MDPDAALANLREALEKVIDMADQGRDHGDDYINALECVALQVQTLDGWMSKGGFLPRAWIQPRLDRAEIRAGSVTGPHPGEDQPDPDDPPWSPYRCPRCGGDHSWCQSVQPGEFGPE